MIGSTYIPQGNFIFVQGIEGAKAYQMPVGFDKVVLWDTEQDVFYVKALDQIGRPFIAKTCSYQDCETPKPQAEAQAPQVDMSNYISKEQLESVLGRLYVNPQGRIMLSDEPSK